jgi:acyl-lipid omega-6 desaturase (Delta-12 desaturase)
MNVPMEILAPLTPDAPLPHRKQLRGWLQPLRRMRTAYPLLMLALDAFLFCAALAGTIFFASPWLKLACGLLEGLVISRLFILGHDACHQSLTPHRRLNRIVGRIALLPSLTPYSLWEVGHNVVHHGYTNLKGVDFVWSPCTREEYLALSAWGRLLERIYRSGWAPGLYYFVEIWWKRLFFPSARHMATRRRLFVADSLLVTAFGLAWAALLVAMAARTGQSAAWLLATGAALPLAVWFGMIGFVVYVHHTHREVAWHTDRGAWARAQPFVSTTVHLRFRAGIGALLHHIMEHTAHHVDMSIPFYDLTRAQERLETMLPGRIIVQRFSFRWYFATARCCKLYDFARDAWTDFEGQPTSP